MDRHAVIPPPIPTPALLGEQPQRQLPPPNAEAERHDPGSDAGSASEHDVSEDEDEGPGGVWQPIEEDKSEPCDDELRFIESRRNPRSASDHAHWEEKTFFDLDDPELVPLEHGRIEFHIGAFNGTKEKPNTEQLMRSPIVKIGGLDWQIKFYPKGNDSDFLSCYVECLTMSSPDFDEYEDFEHLPFPRLKCTNNMIKKRRSVAVQVGVVMYNPAEPRVFEYKSEAAQLSKSTPDFGWKYFSENNRYEFHYRQHTQRQAILRNDKLSLTAYIRIVHDPTGCMWRQESRNIPEDIIAITGLRPFTKSLQYISATMPLLHFSHFRQFVQRLRPDTRIAEWLQPLLLKMYTRRRSATYGSRGIPYDADAVEMLWRLSTHAHWETLETPDVDTFGKLVGTFHSGKGSACGSNRLNTKDYPSVQAAVDHQTRIIPCPELLTLELQRQEHDKKERKWKKLTHKVKVEEHITISGVSYTLFAFITHCGPLNSTRYNSYVRPKGPGKGWYAYQDAKVTRLTEKQARERHSGADSDTGRSKSPENGYDSPFSEHHGAMAEVTSAVMYVRDDVASDTFDAPEEDDWIPPSVVEKDLKVAEPLTAFHENFGADGYPATVLEVLGEEEYARLRAMIDQTADEVTPEPNIMDGEDVVMRDAEDTSAYSIDEQETEPCAEGDDEYDVGTSDWLGRAYFQGELFNRQFHGGGHYISTTGDEYLGRFEHGRFHGYGKLIYANTGDIYEGDFVKGEPHGKGKLVELSSGNVYTGMFKEGHKHGEFTLTGTVTEEDKSSCHICYEQPMSTAFYDCGHVVACRDCAAKIDICPVCRRRVLARLQLYGVRISQS